MAIPLQVLLQLDYSVMAQTSENEREVKGKQYDGLSKPVKSHPSAGTSCQ
jgi:hypothetical protein